MDGGNRGADPRFLYCCDLELLRAKKQAVEGARLNIYNANSATLLESLKFGIAGYSGIMANFHPECYVWLLRNWEHAEAEAADHLSSFLTMSSWIEKQLYPVNAKYYLMLEGVLSNYRCRVKDHSQFSATDRLEVEQVRRFSKAMAQQYAIS
ncbi:dihydrodipicolinate synthase family protein [Paenibacillus aestuarii]|uniref:Dihydrodipicolinate synthase family protein n=1 Tax=Paenibacillus aestuarii TaxID=516965 RepID=A0ABW0KHJ1_9BACL